MGSRDGEKVEEPGGLVAPGAKGWRERAEQKAMSLSCNLSTGTISVTSQGPVL